MDRKKDINVRKLIEKLTSVKKETILVIFLTGALLLIIVWPSGSKGSSMATNGTEKEDSEVQNDREQESLWDYKKRMEKELEEMLESMEGVGEASVMISVGDSGKAVVEKDVSQSKHSEGEGDSVTLTDSERSEETVYGEGDSGEQPFVVNTLTPQIQGVLVVATGGDDPEVKAKVLEAVMALFQLESHKISIVKGK